MRKIKYLVLIIVFLQIVDLKAQIHQKGRPFSFQKKTKSLSEIPYVSMPSFDVAAMKEEDEINRKSKLSQPDRFAKGFDVNYSLKNSGLWEYLPNGAKIWRLGIKSKGAYSINILFTEYKIPQGARVFIYSKDTTEIIGAFTVENNTPSKVLATMPVPSDEIVVEYYEPQNAEFVGELTIGKVGHDYTGVFRKKMTPLSGELEGKFGISCSNEIDINCSDGINWQIEKRAVVNIVIDVTHNCTGALINNAALDDKPYLLTAQHCICNQATANGSLFVFNFDNPTCGGKIAPSDAQSVSGATLRASNGKSDFTLLELNTKPPASYNVYYAGWDRTENPLSLPVVGIHHPKGDIKKISTSNTSVLKDLSTFNNPSGCTPTGSIDIWLVNWTRGLVEKGSSGSPLFDANHKIRGQASGGSSGFCGTPPNYASYGRLAISWDYGTTAATRLKDWLDPLNSGVTVLNGSEACRNLVIENKTYDSNATVTNCDITLKNVTIQKNSDPTKPTTNVIFDATNTTTIIGPFEVKVGCTLEIR